MKPLLTLGTRLGPLSVLQVNIARGNKLLLEGAEAGERQVSKQGGRTLVCPPCFSVERAAREVLSFFPQGFINAEAMPQNLDAWVSLFEKHTF